MFKDTQKELERLEAELLAQEPEDAQAEESDEEWDDQDSLWDDETDFGQEVPEVYRNFSNHYKAYNSDRTDWDPEELGDALDRPSRAGIWALCALAMALVAGIFLVLAWWVVKLNGGWL